MSPARLPGLAAVRAFEATVRLGSMARAADELHVTVSAVSRAVRDLERDLGRDLLRRGSRAIAPMPVANALAKDVAEALSLLHLALDRARVRAPEVLVLGCEPLLLARWLEPRAEALREALGPGREVRLVATGPERSFGGKVPDLDIARSHGHAPDGTVAVPFLEERVGPVCRPDAAAEASGSGPVDGVILHAATSPEAWATWSRRSGTALRPDREIRFEHWCPCMAATVDVAGLAMGPVALVADAVAAGTLAVPRGFTPDGTRYALLRSDARPPPPQFDAVLGWLRDEAARLPEPAA